MSFLGDIVSSIGGEKAPAPPIKPPSRPSSTKPLQSVSTTTKPASNLSSTKPQYKGTAGSVATSQPSGLKRKADDSLNNTPLKSPRANAPANAIISSVTKQLPTDLKISSSKSTNGAIATPSSAASAAQAKPPTKGSYAEMLARAKEAQGSKTQSQVGIIKHQAIEKIKSSKLAERRREELEKPKNDKNDKNRALSRPDSAGKSDSKRRSVSPAKKGEQAKQAKGPRPPLHAPTPQYKGTMGMASKNGHDQGRHKRRSQRDEYLGTDEEDEGDLEDYGSDNYYSDESSDMEGGFDEVQDEENRALRQAKEDDARELALEQQLKKEKLDRKQRLQAMATKRR